METTCTSEFQVKHFGFADVTANRFYQSQWGKNRLVFFVYRLFVFLYTMGWIVYNVATFKLVYWVYLTNWTEVTGCLYFLLSFVVVTYGYATKCKTDYELRWFHKVTWIVYNVALATALGTDILYWFVFSSSLPASVLTSAPVIHSHMVNYILLLIDLFLNDIPTRFLHFIYPIGFGIVYVVFVLILHGANYTSAVYSLLDFKNTPLTAVGYSLGSIFIALPIAFIVHFGFYHLRLYMARRCNKDNSDDCDEVTVEKSGEINKSFEV